MRDRDRERERMERLERERERERLHARERDMVHYDLNDEDLLNERSYGADFTSRGHPTNRHNEDSRYPSSSQPPQASRRDRDEYSPHRSGGNSRRVLNAM